MVLEVLAGGWLTRGAECAAFEEEFCRAVGAFHALALNSCTAALHLAL
ncbi:MAG: DegT/DnrJ/EryC1/StrS family aminotransferase, partial [Candidatus Omnitrophica bacterium]|nr:DegT/DnrJ/EryC1/StrS family aminotransferase [Candidatus Omnitrophota bacterium]